MEILIVTVKDYLNMSENDFQIRCFISDTPIFEAVYFTKLCQIFIRSDFCGVFVKLVVWRQLKLQKVLKYLTWNWNLKCNLHYLMPKDNYHHLMKTSFCKNFHFPCFLQSNKVKQLFHCSFKFSLDPFLSLLICNKHYVIGASCLTLESAQPLLSCLILRKKNRWQISFGRIQLMYLF